MVVSRLTELDLRVPSLPMVKSSGPTVAMTLLWAAIGGGAAFLGTRAFRLPMGWQVLTGASGMVVGGTAYKLFVAEGARDIPGVSEKKRHRQRSQSAPGLIQVFSRDPLVAPPLPPPPVEPVVNRIPDVSDSPPREPEELAISNIHIIGDNDFARDHLDQFIASGRDERLPSPSNSFWDPVALGQSFENLPPEVLAQHAAERAAMEQSERALKGVAFQRKCAITTLSLLLDPEKLLAFQQIIDKNTRSNQLDPLQLFFAEFVGKEDPRSLAICKAAGYLCDFLLFEDELVSLDGIEELKARDELVASILANHFGLSVIPVTDDGDCLFTALDWASGQTNLRERVATYLTDEVLREVAPLIRQDIDRVVTCGDQLKGYPAAMKERIENESAVYYDSPQFLVDYREGIRQSRGVWGGGVELQHILPNVIGKSLVVYSGLSEDGPMQYDPIGGPTEEKVSIFYWSSRAHYDALVKLES